MAPLLLCSTGLSPAERAELQRSIARLGRRVAYEGDLTDQTTHLVATRVTPRSAKLGCAMRLGLPLVVPAWIHESARAGRILMIEERHILPPLAGVVIRPGSLSISPSDTEAIRAAVEAAGGTYASAGGGGEKCTHRLLTAGSDAEALEGEILVSPAWLRDSLRLGVAQDESEYAVPLLSPSSQPPNPPPPLQPLGDTTNQRLQSSQTERTSKPKGEAAPSPSKASLMKSLAGSRAGEVSSHKRVGSAGSHPRLASSEEADPKLCESLRLLHRSLLEDQSLLRCAHLSHPEYFLQCLRSKVEPVLIKDKKVLLKVRDERGRTREAGKKVGEEKGWQKRAHMRRPVKSGTGERG
ncbi:MAG: hypothetical protein SGPRY_013588 [Prymnesium sp.]